MFFEKQPEEQQKRYEKLLKIISSLSKLSADSSSIPYLYYRMAENIFCRAFNAKNLSRSDISVDASKDDIGLGLKTFIHKNGHSLEKIAEFNRERILYSTLLDKPKELAKQISNLRNQRIISTCGISSTSKNKLYYHCITRGNSVLYIHEEPIHLIDITNISLNKTKNNTLSFNDGIEEYCFNIAKSTLFKRFQINPIYEIPVKIFDDPFELLENYIIEEFQEDNSNHIVDTIFLPLYSIKKGTHYVPEKSGLNHWNARGRKRDVNEVYIPIPSGINKHSPNFFPSREDSFTLSLPNGEFIVAKVCQDDGKALQSNPNKDLGKWILRDVLNMPEKELVTYEKLMQVGIDTVQINKFEDGTYEINFREIGTFENYLQGEGISRH